MPQTPNEALSVSAVEIQASQIIERLEEAVEKATEAVMLLDQSNEKDSEPKEVDLGLKGKNWSINQGFLQPKGRSMSQILAVLEDLIVFENNKDSEDGEGVTVTSLVPLSAITKASLVAQSIAAFVNTLDRSHSNYLNNRIHNDTTRWITHLFRFYESQAFYHEEPLEGLVKLTRMLLHHKYPKYLELGFECLVASPPVIYTAYSSLAIVHHLCRQMGLSLSCVHPVSSANDFPSHQLIDISCLERIIKEDKASNKVPLLLLADAGTLVTGHVDNLCRLQDVCRHEDIWLHVKGHSLATLAMISATNVPSRIADSMSLALATWLGAPGLPTATLFRPIRADSRGAPGAGRESTLPLIAGLVVDHLQKGPVALPLWFALQGFGRDEIQQRIRGAFEKCHVLWEKLSKYSWLRLLSQRPGGDSGSLTFQELINKSVTPSTLIFEVTASTVVFQFVPETNPPGMQFTGKVPIYYDKLNSWLGQVLQQDMPQLNVEICELEYAGVVLRICPLEAIIPMSDEDVELLVSYLEQQLEIMVATVRLKKVFQRSLEENRWLELVVMEEWAGLGGVRYVPENLRGTEADAEECKEELNKLNAEIVNKLRATDEAFSLGVKEDGLMCIRFGMVTAETDLGELLSLVTTIGKEVEESSKYLDTMVEIVKKGIETATIDLQKENEERLWQEGILRHVPVFGSLVNWWSPKTKETGIRGRSLNLQAGVVESTENIYRYHMQLQQGASSPPGTRSPPQPLVQTPIVADSSSRHSRTSSHCSQVSAKSNSVAGDTITADG